MNQLDSNAILFADDNPSFLMYIGILVKRLGYKVYLALDGLEAMRVAKERKPTIIVIDYALPKINGESCLNLIRNDAYLRDTPVIMLGPEGNNLSTLNIEKMDIQDYLKKTPECDRILSRNTKMSSPFYQAKTYQGAAQH